MVVKLPKIKRHDKDSTYTEVFHKFALHYTQNSFQNSRMKISEYIQVQFMASIRTCNMCNLHASGKVQPHVVSCLELSLVIFLIDSFAILQSKLLVISVNSDKFEPCFWFFDQHYHRLAQRNWYPVTYPVTWKPKLNSYSVQIQTSSAHTSNLLFLCNC